eukprot:6208264-Pleurochrysis_carterae.AAC.2
MDKRSQRLTRSYELASNIPMPGFRARAKYVAVDKPLTSLCQACPLANACLHLVAHSCMTCSQLPCSAIRRELLWSAQAEPGYVKKLRADDETRFRGFLCKRDVH